MLVLLVVTVLEVGLSWGGYLAWFRPSQYMEWVNRSRSRTSEIFPFVMRLWTVRLLSEHPKVDLWWARVVVLMMLVVSTLVWLTALAEVLYGGH